MIYWMAALRYAWRHWKAESRRAAEREIIHDCRPVATPAGSLTGRLECRICAKRIGRHEQIDQYGNWQHPQPTRQGSYLRTRSAAVYVGGTERRGPGHRGAYDLEDTSDQGIGACGFPGCRCVETNRRAIQFGFDLAGDPLVDCIGEFSGIPVVTHPHSRNGA